MARLTRSESQLRNRALLLAAARRLFLTNGYLATSLAAVAEEAGFSTGVVYSNFTGKAEVALLVLRDIQAEQLTALRGALAGDESLDVKLDRVQQWAEAALDSGWSRLELEFALDVRSDPALVAEEASRHESATALAAEALAGLVPDDLAALIPLRAAAEALLNLSYGVAVRRLVDPSVSVERLLKPLRESLRTTGLLGPAR
jgi:AcrR family transcriptional regulator